MNPGEIEVRCPARTDGSTPLDEIVGQGVNIHLEQIDRDTWWVQIYGKDKTVTVVLHTGGAPINATWNYHEPMYFEAVRDCRKEITDGN